MLAPPRGLTALLRGILDPPLQTMMFGVGTQKLGRGGHRRTIYTGTINGFKGEGTRNAPLSLVHFFSISCSFRKTMAKIIGWRNPGASAPFWEILDLPLATFSSYPFLE